MKTITFEELRSDLHNILDEITFQPYAVMLADGRRLVLSSEEAYLSECRHPRQALKISELSEQAKQALRDAVIADTEHDES